MTAYGSVRLKRTEAELKETKDELWKLGHAWTLTKLGGEMYEFEVPITVNLGKGTVKPS